MRENPEGNPPTRLAQEDGDEIDCTRMGIGGKAIPSNMTKVTHLRSDALFVLLVEKEAAFMRLSEDRFYNQYPCVIITVTCPHWSHPSRWSHTCH